MINKIELIIKIVKQVGKIQMKYYKHGFDVSKKNKDIYDLLTNADVESDKFIRSQLQKYFPDYPILSEENDLVPTDFSGNVWMVDPLDGTKEFVAKNDQFSVMIGLCEDGIPILGVVYAPVFEELIYAQKGKGAILAKKGNKKKLKVDSLDDLSKAVLINRNPHGEERTLDYLVENLGVRKIVPYGSIGMKLNLIATGKAHIHINNNFRLSKWDLCAPQVILEEAGGKVTDRFGKSLDFTQKSIRWQNSVVATNGVLHDKVIRKIRLLLERKSK